MSAASSAAGAPASADPRSLLLLKEQELLKLREEALLELEKQVRGLQGSVCRRAAPGAANSLRGRTCTFSAAALQAGAAR